MPEWKLTTPINTFEHPASGSLVDLVSVVHVGTPGYYRRLGGYIMERQADGFTVHYENISSSHETVQPTTLTEALKRKLHEAKTDVSADNLLLVEDFSSYVTQYDPDMFGVADAENHDITEADYVSRSSLIALAGDLIGARRMKRRLEKAADNGTDAVDEVIFQVLKKDIDEATNGPQRRNNWHDAVTIQARNQVALEGVDGALADNPAAKLVLVWGIGHLAGLQSGLLNRGYEHVGRQEVDLAINLSQIRRDRQRRETALRRQQI